MIIFIVAPPRSGTTYLYNLICQEKIALYPSNILKFFKFNLKLGFLVQKIIKKFLKSNFINNKIFFGSTKGILSPAEAGYIFRKFINLNNNELYKDIKKENIIKLVSFLKNVKGKQKIIIKNFYTIKYISYIDKLFPECKWIFINRNLEETTKSFYKMRKTLKNKQFPIIYIKNYQDNIKSVKLNIKLFKSIMKKEKLKISKKNYIEINFNSLIRNPVKNIKLIKGLIKSDL